MLSDTSALACATLALAAGVLPSGSAPLRLAALHRRAGRVPGRHGLPLVAATTIGALAGLPVLGPAGALVGAAAVVVWRRRRAHVHRDRATDAGKAALAGALGRITEDLRTGAHPAAAMRGAPVDGDPAQAVLRPAAAAAELGHGVAAALVAEAARHPEIARDLRQVARAWTLAERHGVPLADLLAAAHADLRWRVAYTARVGAALAGPRATAAVLTGLPALGILLGELVGAAPLQVLRSGALGQMLVVCGVGLLAAGAAWAQALMRSAVPR